MQNYTVISFKHETGAIFETIGANFVSRGTKHSQSIVEEYAQAYKQKHNYSDLDHNFTIYFRKTNPRFEPNQLKVYRGKISGCVSRNVATERELIEQYTCPVNMILNPLD